LLRAAAVGLLAGGLAVAFRWAIYAVDGLRLWLLDGALGGWGSLLVPLLALAAGCLVGWLTLRYAPDAPGSGIPHVKEVLQGERTMSWRSILPVKFVGGALGIGTGLSLGLEGPTVQMGACAGQAMSEATKATPDSTRALLANGSGAGLAAIFNAPLAGFIFTLEELRRPLTVSTYSSTLVGVLCAVMVARALTGQLPSFAVRGFPAAPLATFPFVLLIGAAAGLLGVVFNQSLRGADRLGRRIRILPRWCLPGLVGAAAGVLSWWVPGATGSGHETAQHLLSGEYQTGVVGLIGLLVLKLVMTATSYGSGAPGGIFAPMLVLGTILGTIVGKVASTWAPELSPTPTAFAVLGMAAMFTASVRAPLTGISLILEMTGEQSQLFAVCGACLTAYLVAEALGEPPIYDALVEDDRARRRAAAAEHETARSPE
jgi:CIC family chloride channel protein